MAMFSALFCFNFQRFANLEFSHTTHRPKKLEEILTALLAYNKLPLKIKEMTTKNIIAESSWFFLQVPIPVRRSRRTASKQKGVISFFVSPGSEIQTAAAAPSPHVRRNRRGIHTYTPAPHWPTFQIQNFFRKQKKKFTSFGENGDSARHLRHAPGRVPAGDGHRPARDSLGRRHWVRHLEARAKKFYVIWDKKPKNVFYI